MIAPYNTALDGQSAEYRGAWARWVLAKLLREEGPIRGKVIEVHAGKAYFQSIVGLLEDAGATVRRPLVGLGIGDQLAWYERHGSFDTTAQSEATDVPSESEPVVEALLSYGRRHHAERAGAPPQFTPNPDANDLLLNNPFAFLLAVLFSQGIPAERAWQAPYELQQRLGHLDPARIAAEPDRTRTAVAQPPALHRYVNDLSDWIVDAARQVTVRYGGEAQRVWSGEPRAADLAAQLRTFNGIGQKKAAMAVEILARDLKVPVLELTGTDIAYDVHVRRVFLRTRLADSDNLDHMVGVARRLHPERPGEMDFPAWLIGRRWCGPGLPACAERNLSRFFGH